jgi:adenine-specific DNA-methyltransferase
MSELDKKLMRTPDLNKERLEKLKSLFPDLFTAEGNLNPDELKKIVDPDLVKETERFEFKWFGKSEAKRTAFTPSKATLLYDEERSVNPEYADGNMIIEGENLETLKCLLAGYRERVKCIYIDPPYNTGKDFVYSDKWDENKEDYWDHIGVTEDGVKVDTNLETSGRYHSNWLNMIYSRLLLARQLLREDGVILISIDDNEVHHLRKLCNEVFGDDNFIDCIVWKKRYGGGAKEKHLVTLHEYILFYAKDITKINPIFIANSEEAIDRYYKLKDENSETRGGYRTHPLEATKSMGDRPNLIFPITDPDGTEVFPKRQWLWGKDRVETALAKGEIAFLKDKEGNWSIHTKQYLRDEQGNVRQSKAFSIIEDVFTQHGTNEVIEIFGNAQIFSFPKPTSFISKLLSIGTEENEGHIVLDFFAGCGTTAQSVLELNEKDGGNRKFILVQIPELTDETSEAYKAGYKKISEITIERNKRVIQKIEKEEAEKQPSLLDSDKKPFKTGFKVYKLAKSNFPRVDFAPDPAKTEEENLALLNKYIDEKEAMFLSMVDEKNIFDEALLKNGFMLNYSKVKADGFSKNKVFQIKDGFKECLICMDMNLSKETLKELEQFKDKIFICLERALDTTMKWNLKHLLGDKLIAF